MQPFVLILAQPHSEAHLPRRLRWFRDPLNPSYKSVTYMVASED